jgi:hypothetical protein
MTARRWLNPVAEEEKSDALYLQFPSERGTENGKFRSTIHNAFINKALLNISSKDSLWHTLEGFLSPLVLFHEVLCRPQSWVTLGRTRGFHCGLGSHLAA